MNTNQLLINFIYNGLFECPIEQLPENPDFSDIFVTAKQNSVSGLVFAGMKKTAALPDQAIQQRFQVESDKAMYAYLMQSQQAASLSAILEQAGIPFVLMKGSRMRDFYPSPELRTSGDIDILVQAEDDTLRALMEKAGFRYEGDDENTMNFTYGAAVKVELHRHLFDDKMSFFSYFDKIWDRLQPKEGWKFRYEMTEEDFFNNMIAHFSKHFSRYGCGIRNAIDVAVYLKNAPQNFDLCKAEENLKEIGLYDFEQRLLQLLQAWETNDWSDEDAFLTDYILGCGLFGSTMTRTVHTLSNAKDKNARKKSLLIHFFPDFRTMSNLYPILKKCPILLPFCWIARCFRLIFTDRKKIHKTLNMHSKIDKQSLSEVNLILQKMHLEDFGTR